MALSSSDKEPISILELGEFDCHETSGNYRILRGTVDLFLSPTTGKEKGKRYHIGRFSSNQIIWGLKSALKNPPWQLLATATPDTMLEQWSWQEIEDALEQIGPQEAILNAARAWERTLLTYARAHEQDVQLTPVTKDALKTQIFTFYQNIFPLCVKTVHLEELCALEHAQNLKQIEQQRLKRSYEDMLSILHEIPAVHQVTSEEDSLTPCIWHIADLFKIKLPEKLDIKTIEDATIATGVQFREITLSGQWWQKGTNPMLLMTEANHFCLAVPKPAGGYELIDPLQHKKMQLGHELAQTFKSAAWQAYRPLPQKKLSLWDVARFSFWGTEHDLLRLLLVGALAALLSLATPWFTAFIFDYIVPNGEINQLLQVILALIVAGAAAGLFQLVRAIAVLRLSSKLNLNLEVAIWDRLIRLPAIFFKDFTTGELTIRATAASGMRHLLAGATITSLLSGIFSITSFLLLFYYDARLALIATASTVILAAFTAIISFRQFYYYKITQDKLAKLSGIVVQLLTGIAKIQASGKEKIAFAQWARTNTELKANNYNANWLQAILSTFNAFWLPFLTLIIFAYISSRPDQLSVGAFLAFNAALGQFTSGMVGLISVLGSIIHSLPMLKQTKPIIETLPEIHTGKIDPGPLRGKIEVDNLKFRYAPKGPMILKGVSFTIEEGKYLAVTGPSGSGKSTLFRLLLGFEKALSGSIFFDEHELDKLNPQQVRKQCGVVLQNSMLMPGSLYENIVGSALLSQEEAWRAAERAGMKEDIEAMPMGMHTLVSERGGTLSGGQRQRTLIARALAKNPRILFFDEATSALDNRTQSIVMKSLEELAITRIVIAHRLTTIQKADLILVMDQGEIVQKGTYQQLMAEPGLFKSMAERQLAEQPGISS